jgi:tetratricopeptide (TPR) repeat protein
MEIETMNFWKRSSCLVAGLCLALTVFANAAKKPRDEAEAIEWAQEALQKQGCRNIQVNSQYILFADNSGNYGIALARISNISMEYSGGMIYRVFFQDFTRDQRDAVALYPRYAEKFHTALEFLADNARVEARENLEREYANFEVQLKAWREAAVKPTMPEAAREHQVLAEFAFKEKNIDKAISEYIAAVSVFPTWAEGQYNLAMLAGEKKMYDVAIQHMREYLELAPDSPDAQAAKDSVIIWKDKWQTIMANSSPNLPSANNSGRGTLFQQTAAQSK